jgi:hypothetical protein
MSNTAHGTIRGPQDIFPGQYRWDPLDYYQNGNTADQARAAALAERGKIQQMVRKYRGDLQSKVWTLTGQLRKYESLGVPDGRTRNVYYLNVSMKGQI